MSVSSLRTALLPTLALSWTSACGPSAPCNCAGDDVNASIWSAADGTLLVAGYSGADTGFVKTVSGSRLVEGEFFELPLWHGWGSAVSDYFVVGGSIGSASVVHRAGSRVQVWGKLGMAGPVDAARSIWGAGNDSVFVVGSNGAIAHFDGLQWAAQESGVTADLRDVWGTAADDVFAVGLSGTVVHFDGTRWSPFEVPSSADLNAVWGSSATDVFAVGETEPEQAHQILHYDGEAWRVVHEGAGGLLGVHGSAADRVVAVGGLRTGSGVESVVMAFDGTEWSEVSSHAGTFLWDVWVSGESYTVIGPRGTVKNQAF